MRDFTRPERATIEEAWRAMEYAANFRTSVRNELADALKYEVGHRTAGRPRIWAKALILCAYREGKLANPEMRLTWLADCTGVSRGIRYGYLLGMDDRALLVRNTQSPTLLWHCDIVQAARLATRLENGG